MTLLANINAALTVLNREGIDINADFHALPSSKADVLVSMAKEHKYRKPANANGSTARYYFAALQRAYAASRK
jgi:hypothetical protein